MSEATKRSSRHLCVSIEGALQNRAFDCWSHNGRPLSRNEAEAMLKIERNRGRKVLPACEESECPDFDYSGGGCPGHSVEPGPAIDEPRALKIGDRVGVTNPLPEHRQYDRCAGRIVELEPNGRVDWIRVTNGSNTQFFDFHQHEVELLPPLAPKSEVVE